MLQTQWNNSLASGVHKNIIIAAHFSQHEAERVRSSPLSEVGKDLLHLFVAALREGDLVLQLLWVELPGAKLGEVMDGPELDDGEDDVHVGDEQEHVQGSRVGNLGEVLPGLQAEEGHGEHCGDAQRDPVGGGLSVEPEGNPGDHHDQDAGTVDLQNIFN